MISQLQDLFGITVESGSYWTELGAVLRSLDQTKTWTIGLGIALVGLIYLIKAVSPKIPSDLIAAVVGTLVVAIFGLADQGVAPVGNIESGVPLSRIPIVPLCDMMLLLFPAAGIALLAYADSAVTVELLALPGGYEIDADEEFFGLGVACIASGVFQGFPVNGSQTRSVVLADSGA